MWDSGSLTYPWPSSQCPLSPHTGVMKVVMMVTCIHWRWRRQLPCPAGPALSCSLRNYWIWARYEDPGKQGLLLESGPQRLGCRSPEHLLERCEPCKSTLAQEALKSPSRNPKSPAGTSSARINWKCFTETVEIKFTAPGETPQLPTGRGAVLIPRPWRSPTPTTEWWASSPGGPPLAL